MVSVRFCKISFILQVLLYAFNQGLWTIVMLYHIGCIGEPVYRYYRYFFFTEYSVKKKGAYRTQPVFGNIGNTG